jgi:hypothetical protein
MPPPVPQEGTALREVPAARLEFARVMHLVLRLAAADKTHSEIRGFKRPWSVRQIDFTIHLLTLPDGELASPPEGARRHGLRRAPATPPPRPRRAPAAPPPRPRRAPAAPCRAPAPACAPGRALVPPAGNVREHVREGQLHSAKEVEKLLALGEPGLRKAYEVAARVRAIADKSRLESAAHLRLLPSGSLMSLLCPSGTHAKSPKKDPSEPNQKRAMAAPNQARPYLTPYLSCYLLTTTTTHSPRLASSSRPTAKRRRRSGLGQRGRGRSRCRPAAWSSSLRVAPRPTASRG